MTNLPDLEKKADILYSRALRYSQADHRGMVKCITCSTVKPWEEMECSHFKDRGWKPLRYFKPNTNIQCHECNQVHNDNTMPYSNWILHNLPAGTLTLLNRKMREHIGSLDYRILLNNIIKDCKQKLK